MISATNMSPNQGMLGGQSRRQKREKEWLVGISQHSNVSKACHDKHLLQEIEWKRRVKNK